MINRPIIISTVILMAAGAYRVFLMQHGKGKPNVSLTRVLVGGYILMVFASVLDLMGGQAARLSGLFLALAVMTALYAVLPDLFSRFSARKGA